MKNLTTVFMASEANLFERLASWVIATMFCGMDFVREMVLRGMAGQTVLQRKEKAMKRERMIFGVSGLIGAVLCAALVLVAGFDRVEAKVLDVSEVIVSISTQSYGTPSDWTFTFKLGADLASGQWIRIYFDNDGNFDVPDAAENWTASQITVNGDPVTTIASADDGDPSWDPDYVIFNNPVSGGLSAGDWVTITIDGTRTTEAEQIITPSDQVGTIQSGIRTQTETALVFSKSWDFARKQSITGVTLPSGQEAVKNGDTITLSGSFTAGNFTEDEEPLLEIIQYTTSSNRDNRRVYSASPVSGDENNITVADDGSFGDAGDTFTLPSLGIESGYAEIIIKGGSTSYVYSNAQQSPGVYLTVDNTAPASCELTAPTTGTVIGSSYTLTATAPSGSEMKEVRWYGNTSAFDSSPMDGTQIGTDSNTDDGTYTYVWGSPGTYTYIRAVAFDDALNSTTSGTATGITYDTTPPTLSNSRMTDEGDVTDNTFSGVSGADNQFKLKVTAQDNKNLSSGYVKLISTDNSTDKTSDLTGFSELALTGAPGGGNWVTSATTLVEASAPAGTYYPRYYITDEAGNTTIYSDFDDGTATAKYDAGTEDFKVDNTAPTGSDVAIAYYLNSGFTTSLNLNASNNPTITTDKDFWAKVTFTEPVKDDGSNPNMDFDTLGDNDRENDDVDLDSGTEGTVFYSGALSFTSAGNTDGNADVDITFRDVYGNLASDVAPVTGAIVNIDTDKPAVSTVTYNGATTITIDCDENMAGSGFTSSNFSIVGATVGDVIGSNFVSADISGGDDIVITLSSVLADDNYTVTVKDNDGAPTDKALNKVDTGANSGTFDFKKPTFTVQYYSEGTFTNLLPTKGGLPITDDGSLWLKITASEALSGNPTYDIEAPGSDGNNVDDGGTTSAGGNAYKSGEITISTGNDGLASVDITGTDANGNTASDATPTSGAQFTIDGTEPQVTSISISGDVITVNLNEELYYDTDIASTAFLIEKFGSDEPYGPGDTGNTDITSNMTGATVRSSDHTKIDITMPNIPAEWIGVEVHQDGVDNVTDVAGNKTKSTDDWAKFDNTAVLFTVEYCTNSSLTELVPTKDGVPILKAGTYYLKITASKSPSNDVVYDISGYGGSLTIDEDADLAGQDNGPVEASVYSGLVYRGKISVSGSGDDGEIFTKVDDIVYDDGSTLPTTTPTTGGTFAVDQIAPEFSILYYNDESLSSQITTKKPPSTGNYVVKPPKNMYLKITANEALGSSPTYGMDTPNGNNDESGVTTTHFSGTVYRSASFDNIVSEGGDAQNATISVSGTDVAGNTGTSITSGGTLAIDDEKPSQITDLEADASSSTNLRIDLKWDAPGNDGAEAGTAAASYTVRYRKDHAINTEEDWAGATDVTGEPSPPESYGTEETMDVTGLTAGDTYYWAVRATDEAGNQGAISNSPSAIAPPYLAVNGSDVGSDMQQDSNNNEMLSLQFTLNGGACTLTSLTFRFAQQAEANTVTESDFQDGGIKLWVDNGTIGQYDGTDVQVSSSQNYETGIVTFSDIGQTLNTTTVNLLLTVDINSTAVGTDYLDVELESESDVSISSPGAKSPANYPIQSGYGVEDYSLPVELSSFTAFADYGKIVLRWRTESEVNNLGFDLYRALSPEGRFEKITERRLQGGGTSASAMDYEYADDEVEEGVTYFYRLESMDYDGTKHMSDLIASAQALTAPKKLALLQNFPNPFNPETSITYTLPRETPVRLTVYNSSGQRIRTLVDGLQSVGVHSVIWNGETDSGTLVGSGVYLYKLHAGNTNQIRRMVFLR